MTGREFTPKEIGEVTKQILQVVSDDIPPIYQSAWRREVIRKISIWHLFELRQAVEPLVVDRMTPPNPLPKNSQRSMLEELAIHQQNLGLGSTIPGLFPQLATSAPILQVKRRNIGHQWAQPRWSLHRGWAGHYPEECMVCKKTRCRDCIKFQLMKRRHICSLEEKRGEIWGGRAAKSRAGKKTSVVCTDCDKRPAALKALGAERGEGKE